MRTKNRKYHFRNLIQGLLFFGMLYSCSPEYIPNMVNTPLFSNKGEFQANIATGTSTFDAQVAYSVTNHLGIMVNSSYADRTDDSTDEFHKHMIFEGGIGYYDRISHMGRVEIYGGYGVGEVKGLKKGFLNSYADATYNRFFIQPAIGLSNNVFDGSFSPRLCLVNLISDEYTNNHFETFFEPVVTAKVGYKYVKVMMQFGLSFPVGGADAVYFDYQPLIFNVGLNFNLGKLWDE